MGSAVLFGTLFFLLSASAACARPSLQLAESGARAGDVVHFSISGVEGGVTYELDVDDEDVADGSGGGGVISGTFTMPEMGGQPWTVTVEAVISGSDRRRKAERDIEYLGRALPVVKLPAPAPPASATVPAVAPEAASSPPSPASGFSSPKALEGPSPSSQAATPRSSHRPRQTHERRAIKRRHKEAANDKPRRRTPRGHDRRHRRAAIRNARAFLRAWRRAFQTAPYPDRTPNGRGREGARIFSLNAIAPHTAVLTANRIRSDDGAATAIVVPALLGLAALTLAGTAVLRRRRLASRRD